MAALLLKVSIIKYIFVSRVKLIYSKTTSTCGFWQLMFLKLNVS